MKSSLTGKEFCRAWVFDSPSPGLGGNCDRKGCLRAAGMLRVLLLEPGACSPHGGELSASLSDICTAVHQKKKNMTCRGVGKTLLQPVRPVRLLIMEEGGQMDWSEGREGRWSPVCRLSAWSTVTSQERRGRKPTPPPGAAQNFKIKYDTYSTCSKIASLLCHGFEIRRCASCDTSKKENRKKKQFLL